MDEETRMVASLSIDEFLYKTQSISAEISAMTYRKLSVDGVDGSVVFQKSISPLSVAQMDMEHYRNMVNLGKQVSDVLYMTKSPSLNGHGNRVTNVGSPIDVSDAATKGYVDTLIHGFENGIYHFSEKSPMIFGGTTYSLSGADLDFGEMFDIFNGVDVFRLYSITLWTHGQVQAGTKISIVDKDSEVVVDSLLVERTSGNSPLKFQFEQPILVDVSHKYYLSTSNENGNSVGIAVKTALSSSEECKCYQYNTTNVINNWLFVLNIEISKTQNVVTGIVLTDVANPSNKFFIRSSNGEIKISELG